jgi:hypothetical protein
MDNSLITEGYTLWVELLSQSESLSLTNLVSQPKNLVNIVFLLYAVASLKLKKGRYIAAFILCELFGNTYLYNSVGGWEIFLGYALIYSVLYWSCRENIKTSMACATMVIFETVMVLDARYYGDVKTVLYVNYEYIVTAIHLYIISTLLPWERIRSGMGNIIRTVYGLFSNSNSVAYINYCYYAHKDKARGECQKVTIG